jgi:predicted PolB exonuclease-like 3'-5' exonuclease
MTAIMPGGTSYLVLDIETVPDRELHAPSEPATGAERPFPPLYACRPIVLGVMWLDEELAVKRVGIIGEGKDEAAMMADFADFMAKFRPHVVTWNGRCFDLPVLALRALRFGLDFSWYYKGDGYRYRYSEEGHLDLCDVVSDHGAAKMTSLDGAARLIGLTGKDGVDGSQVEGLFHAGQIEALRHYCLSDVAQTAFLFLRYRLVSGQIDRDGYRRAASGMLAALEADGRFGRLLDGLNRRLLLLGD